MTAFQDIYRQLLQADPSREKHWLLDHRPVDMSPAHWWIGFIDRAVSDVYYEHRGWPQTRPRADAALAAALIDWALEDNFPIEHAINNLVQLIETTLAAGRRLDTLPANAQPDNVARQAVARFGFTRSQAVARAAELRSQTISDDDFVQPGENIAEILRLLSDTDDYKDYHRLLGIERMLNDLKPVSGLLTDADLATELAAWLQVLPELNPVPSNPVDEETAPPERIGVVGASRAAADERRLLTTSDGVSTLVGSDLANEQLAEQFGLDRVVTAPVIDFCAAVHLDGPLAGQTGYAINELGNRVEFALPPRPGGLVGFYEVTRLATDDQPAELRFVGFDCPVHEKTNETGEPR